MPPGLVVRAARRLWGSPVQSAVEGEMLWKLRCGEGDGLPAYVSVGVGEPCLLFSACQAPERPEVPLVQIRQMLVEATGSANS